MIPVVARTRLFVYDCISVLYLTTAVCQEGPRGVCSDDISLLQVGPGLTKLGKQRHSPTKTSDRRALQTDAAPRKHHQALVDSIELRGDAHGAFDVTLLKVGANGSGSVGLMQDLPNADAFCLVNTGASCSLNKPCSKLRGKSNCESSRCLCEKGCADANGVCTKHSYKVILENCTIRNFRYGTYLYASYMGSHLSTSITNNSHGNHFTLVETHDGKFIIYSLTYPDHVVTISRRKTNQMTMFRPDQRSVKGASDIEHVKLVPPNHVVPSARSVALSFTKPPDGYDDEKRNDLYQFYGDHPVMLQSVEFKRHYIYAPRVSVAQDVFTTYDDQGDGALWIFDPPLPEAFITGNRTRVQDFVGRRCKKDCHDKSREVGDTISWFSIFLLGVGVVIAVLLLGYLIVLSCINK